MIERYHRRYLLAVVDHGSFSWAALACNVTQPTLSAAIARIENMLGQRRRVMTCLHLPGLGR